MSGSQRNDSGLSEQQEAFLDWLVDPTVREGDESQNAFAKRLGVNPGTLSKWRKTVSFRKEWERRLAETNVSPDRLQDLMDVLYLQGKHDGNVKAIELYMKLVDRMTPDKTLIVQEKPAADLTDAELAAQLEEQAAELRRKAMRAV